MTFILSLSSAVVGLLSLTQLHTLQHRQELLWLFHFELLQKKIQGMFSLKIYQVSWSIFIDLDAHYVSSFTEVFLWKNPFKHSFMLCRIILHYFRSTMSFTYTYQKCCSAPTHFLVNTCFIASLYKTICFDHFIKAYIPTPRCLHLSIDGSLELAHFVSTFRISKTFWLHHIQLFLNKSRYRQVSLLVP